MSSVSNTAASSEQAQHANDNQIAPHIPSYSHRQYGELYCPSERLSLHPRSLTSERMSLPSHNLNRANFPYRQ
jgi:hypothetical protein